MKRVAYFAYGSNTDAAQMSKRCPGAVMLQRGLLKGYRLRFAGASSLWDGCGVADVVRVPFGRGIIEVQGVLWSVTADELFTLDRYEGHPHSYERQPAPITTDDGRTINAWIYAKPTDAIERAPSPRYVATIRAGYEAHDLDVRLLDIAVQQAPKPSTELAYSSLVFVYGSLLSGLPNHHYLNTSEFYENAQIDHVNMVSMGGFPACSDGTGMASGEVWRVSKTTIKTLDQLEGHPHFYRRQKRRTTTGLSVWIYLMNKVSGYRHRGPVSDGCWRTHWNAYEHPRA